MLVIQSLMYHWIIAIDSVYAQPSMPVTNEGLCWDSRAKKWNSPGGDDCILGPGGSSEH